MWLSPGNLEGGMEAREQKWNSLKPLTFEKIIDMCLFSLCVGIF
jgi:hypothetical protein